MFRDFKSGGYNSGKLVFWEAVNSSWFTGLWSPTLVRHSGGKIKQNGYAEHVARRSLSELNADVGRGVDGHRVNFMEELNSDGRAKSLSRTS